MRLEKSAARIDGDTLIIFKLPPNAAQGNISYFAGIVLNSRNARNGFDIRGRRNTAVPDKQSDLNNYKPWDKLAQDKEKLF